MLDEQDLGGPAALADYERQTAAAQSALVLEQGSWQWLEQAGMRIRRADSGAAAGAA